MATETLERSQPADGKLLVQGEVPDPEKLDGEAKALVRALPYTRITDYQMSPADARELLWRVAAGESWPEVGRQIADREAARARAAQEEGRTATARQSARWALGAYNTAQAALNSDSDLKIELYEAFTEAVAAYAAVSAVVIERLRVEWEGQTLSGWLVLPPGGRADAGVVTWGGFSGWGAAFLASALELAERGIACILAEGPGQGLTRIHHGLFMSDASRFAAYGAFIDALDADERIDGPIGIQGNSFGGLLAARVAASDARVAACVINCAPSRMQVPQFRTAREQVFAYTGTEDEDEANVVLAGLGFDPGVHRITAPTLVLRGGADALVSDDDVARFLEGTVLGRRVTWPDGEHTLYNHAEERNSFVADWFVDVLTARG